MKKLILLSLTTACAALGVHAQGTVTLANTTTTLVTCFPPFGGPPPGVPVPVGAAKVALYGGYLGASEGQLVQLGPPTLTRPYPGRYSGGIRTNPFVFAGAMATFQVRAWSAAFETYEEAIAWGHPSVVFVGKGNLFNSSTGGAGIPPSIPVNLAAVTPQLNVYGYCIPEPSIMALALLGVASALLFRHRT